MKIGLLTYHSVYNFGAKLQVYSTIGYLKNHGHDPVIINWIPEDLEVKSNRAFPVIQADAFNEFTAEKLPRTEICRNDDDIVRVIHQEKIEAVIIGSDVVLQHRTFWSRVDVSRKGISLSKPFARDVLFPNPFWGSFLSKLSGDVPAVIMSASSQNVSFRLFRGRLRRDMCKALLRFKTVTVRDEWTRKMVRYLSFNRINPLLTPDPVFAFNQNIKEQPSKEDLMKKFSLPENYLLVSFRSRTGTDVAWLSRLKEIALQNNLQCVALPMPNGIRFEHPFDYKVELPLRPDEWYALIRHSSGYVGENMHPIVIALHNSVPFFAFDSYGIVKLKYFVNEKSSKIYDILAGAGFLDNRINILGRGYKPPTPEAVMTRITGFDVNHCNKFSNTQQERYNQMMEQLLPLITSAE